MNQYKYIFRTDLVTLREVYNTTSRKSFRRMNDVSADRASQFIDSTNKIYPGTSCHTKMIRMFVIVFVYHTVTIVRNVELLNF